ncbi:MAG: hypothetical protein ACR2NZ_00525, partial [Rubripirellula sp.]
LRQLTRLFRGTRVETVATEALDSRAEQMLTQVRDANQRRDHTTRNDISRQLADGFEGDLILKRAERRLSQQELKARELLRLAMRHERSSKLQDARASYVEILQLYASTLTARKAKDRLTMIDRRLAVPDEEDADKALERMLESATSIAPPNEDNRGLLKSAEQ